uniref:Uncharacterized protein n=1 Tax=Glossina pallidipes TaxID=7398 RepID=A0A1A9ZPK7_GLOPL
MIVALCFIKVEENRRQPVRERPESSGGMDDLRPLLLIFQDLQLHLQYVSNIIVLYCIVLYCILIPKAKACTVVGWQLHKSMTPWYFTLAMCQLPPCVAFMLLACILCFCNGLNCGGGAGGGSVDGTGYVP